MPTLIDDRMLDRLSREAGESPRRRKNRNLHASYDEPCQRLLNALEPGTYIPPHRHLEPPKPETFVALRGRMAALVFDDDGSVEDVFVFGPDLEVKGVDVPAGVWHAIIALETGSVFFETKPGPYHPLSDKDRAPWAPPEGSAEAAKYLRGLEKVVKTQV